MMQDRFIVTSGKEAKTIGYFIPRLYGWHGVRAGLKYFGFRFLCDILRGRMYWLLDNTVDYTNVA